MSRFVQLLKGSLARHAVKIDIGGTQVTLDVRPLNTFELAEVLQRATTFAASRGVTSDESSALYELGLHVETLAAACVDHDSPEDKPTRYFDSAEQILSSALLTPEHIAFLYAHYEMWADECSPREKELGPAEFMRLIASSHGGDIGPFCSLLPGTQWACFRSLAALYLTSLKDKSSDTSPSSTQKPTSPIQ